MILRFAISGTMTQDKQMMLEGFTRERERSMPPLKKKTQGPSDRLALGADIVKTVGDKALGKKEPQPDGPTVRLAVTVEGGKESSPVGEEAMARHLGPQVRLAHVPGAQGDNNLLGQRGVQQLPEESRPALLVSYVYLEPFLANKHRYSYRDWVLDSGAFSAHNSGTEIKLQDYIDCCKELLTTDPTLTEVFALDVIGDWKESVKNAERMWEQGVQAIPTFHYGSPWPELKAIARDYPKIALGGCVGKRDKDKFAGQCFARVWPKKIHGFGFGSEKSIMLYPFHSIDATNWELAPCRYGHWQAFGGQRVSVRGSSQNLRAEVEWYLDLERQAQERWKKEMEKLEADGPAVRLGHMPKQGADRDLNLKALAPSVRLAEQQGGEEQVRRSGLAKGPTVRLAHKKSGREEGKGLAPSIRLDSEPDAAGGKRIAKTLLKKKEGGK